MDRNTLADSLKLPLKRSALRAKRRQLASVASSPANRMSATHTRVLPLAELPDDALWNTIRLARATLHGFGPASIFNVLMVLHEQGFHLFADATSRIAWQRRQGANLDAINDTLRSLLSDALPKMDLLALVALLSKRPRSSAGKTVTASSDPGILAPLMHQNFGKGKEIHGTTRALAAAICRRLPTWSTMNESPGDALAAFETELHALAGAPALHLAEAITEAQAGSVVPPDKAFEAATIALDPDRTVLSEQDPTARFASVVAVILRDIDLADGDPSGPLKARLTTANGNGLSWLLNRGRAAMLSVDPDQVAPYLGATRPELRDRYAALRAALAELAELPELGPGVHASSRTAVQGMVDSLATNYVKRLLQLKDSVQQCLTARFDVPSALADPAIQRALFTGLAYSASDLKAQIDAAPDQARRAEQAIAVLLGRSTAIAYPAAIDAVNAYTRYLDRTTAQWSEVQKRARDAAERGDTDIVLDALPSWLSSPGKLVELTLREDDPAAAFSAVQEQLSTVQRQRRDLIETLTDRYGLSFSHTLREERTALEEALADALARGRTTPERVSAVDLDLDARRRVLAVLGSAARRCSATTIATFERLLHASGLVGSGRQRRSLRAFLYSGACTIFKHPLSTRRIERVALNATALASLSFDTLGKDFLAEIPEGSRDRRTIELALDSLRLKGLPEEIDPAILTLEQRDDLRSADWIDAAALADGTIRRATFLKWLHATFDSKLSGLSYQSGRQAFSERLELRCFMTKGVLFAPRAREWHPPARYETGAMADAMTRCAVRTASGAVDPVATAQKILPALAEADEPTRLTLIRLLQQLPHDWVVPTGFPSAPQYAGILVTGGDLARSNVRGYRLQVPRHFAGELLSAMIDRVVSPPTLVFERQWQVVTEGIVEVSRRVTANFPVATPVRPDASRTLRPRAIAGIDLGEAGIGVTLLYLNDWREETCFVPSQRIQKLISGVQHYRRRQQPRQSFRKTFSDSLELAKEAAIGELCGVIDNVVTRFQAVPVFESQVRHFERGAKAIQTVYESVMARYVYVDGNDAKKAVRASHWFGADAWSLETPGTWHELAPLKARETVRSGKALEKDLFRAPRCYPGVTVDARGTSQTCSRCERNPIELLRCASGIVQTDREGNAWLQVDGHRHAIRLVMPDADPRAQRQARRKNRRAAFVPLANRRYDLGSASGRQDLERDVKRCLRRSPESVQGRHTSQSHYFCVFTECAAVMHADENASRNIARRYRNRLLDHTALFEAWTTLDRDARIARLKNLGFS